MKDIRDKARELMEPHCRVCPICNGKVCAGQVPGMGGLGSGSSFGTNLEALARFKFNMRLLHSVTEPDTSVTILGRKLAAPVLAAPIGGVEFNMGGKISEADYIESIISGCRAQSVLGCTGDGVPAFIHEAGFAAIKKADGCGIPFIKPWEDEEFFDKVEKALATGADTIGMDIDAAGLITLRKMGRPVSPKPVEKLAEIIRKIGAKFILKGVMTPDEAELALGCGADAIVVSNHGGRVLDHAPGSADVLESVAAKVKGKMAILADGGVRSGGDVLKLLALGADAVMIGRPFSVAAIGGLQQGVETYIKTIVTELKQTMVLTGTQSASSVNSNILFRQ
ncbi:alpha-hydroxy-acid oxidizing protein [Desulforhopalus singaporensis]|uniref:FMN-dependent dehydrogenase, includes L-lactate dehydrogenase and type II isopentenyl diphosphate isomerase n=1 Tax=Desulforhopalus singaporensis TaxID=91360 RepID=A0A1H0V3E5_9BACT|nr:alpha-hydroxy-acid oxidizing protein [Desulforhopalus singaporensis]SDP73059.1 FMN-dependent dehydrogenase, includes L-lactate dehydrogenase and type II isopentenyl diphosphate isomerase [Desulforhopalus singaporensis]